MAEAFAHQRQQHPGINAAAATGHHQPLQGGVAHGGVDAASAAHRRQGGAGAEMGADQPQRSGILAAGGPLALHRGADVLVVEAVEAVAPVALLAQVLRQGIGARGLGQAAVEGRIEAGPLGAGRCPGVGPGDAFEGRGIVQRGQGDQLPEPGCNGRCDPGGRRERLTPMHHPVANARDGAPLGGDGGLQPILQGTARAIAWREAALTPPVAGPLRIDQGGLE